MQIGELSERTGASVRSLRYYDKKHLITGERLENGYRDFDEAQIERVRVVQFYLGLGLGTEQIEGIINCKGRNASLEENPEVGEQCEALLLLYQEKLLELNDQIESLSEARSLLKERIALFQAHRNDNTLSVFT